MSEAGHTKKPHAHPEKGTKDLAAKPEEKKPESAKPEKKVFKAAVIDTSAIVEAQARDAGDARMTESKEDRSGNILKRTVTRIWKHGMFQEYYRQREISKAKEQIMKTGNIYAGEKGGENSQHKAATDAIVDRFTSEYDSEMLRSGETKQMASPEVANKFKDLIKAYAEDPNMTEAAFREGQGRIMREVDPESKPGAKMYSDNIYKIADEMRKSLKHGEKLDNNSYEIELTLGKARDTLKTEAQLTSFDRIVQKLQQNKFGRFIANEPAIIAMGAAVYEGAKALGISALRSNTAKILTFGGAALVSGGIAGIKENARLKQERAQHMRERAKGAGFEKGDKRREEMEQSRYETRSAKDVTITLQKSLEKLSSGKASPAEIKNILAELGSVERDIYLSDKKNADLFSYSKFDQVEQERTQLDLARAKLKVALKKDPEAKKFFGEDLNKHLAEGYFDAREHNEMYAKDEIFRKMKQGKVAKAVISSMVIGAGVGVIAQEALSAIPGSHTDGFFQGLFKNFKGHKGFEAHTTTEGLTQNSTALESLRRYMMGDSAHASLANGHQFLIGHNTHVVVPEGVDMHDNGDGTFNISHGGKSLGDHIPLKTDATGNLTPESQAALGKFGIIPDHASVEGTVPDHIQEKATDYLKHSVGHHGVHRELWYDNDTPKPKFELNELKEAWGGAHHTGINENGDYIFNVKGMTEGGSFHADQSVNAPGEMGGAHLKMLFSLSKGTQDRVFEVMIDHDGNAIIPKDGEIAQLMFSQHNGHAVFHGAFAEVAQSTGGHDGVENVRILSTVEGPGRDILDHIVPKPGVIPTIRFIMPPFIPVPYRTPLEEAKYGVKDGKPARKGPLNLTDPEPGLTKAAETAAPVVAAEAVAKEPKATPEAPPAPESTPDKETDATSASESDPATTKEDPLDTEFKFNAAEYNDEKALSPEDLVKKLDGEFDKLGIKPIQPVFDPETQLAKIAKLPENEQQDAREEFDERLNRQMRSLAKYQLFVNRILANDPDVEDIEISRLKQKFVNTYGFSREQSAKMRDILGDYRAGRTKSLDFRSIYKGIE